MGVQIDYLLLLQHFRDVTGGHLDAIFSVITYFGQILIPILVSAFIYWCVNKKYGAFIILNGAFAVMFNQLLKNFACIYRPWVLDSRIKPVQSALYASSGYSFPSGHTSIATSCWGAIAKIWSKNKILVVSMTLLILAVAFSRNYLGVHTPQDVIVSLVLGVAILFGADRVLNWVDESKNRDLFLAVAVSVFGIIVILYSYLKSYPMDYVNGKLLVNPYHCKLESFPKCGYLIGVFLGWLLERRFVKFEATLTTIKDKIKRYFMGVIPLIILTCFTCSYCEMFLGHHVGRFVTFFLVGFYMTFIYPLCIKKFKV
jgi:membrane-associated phospholipid phosphatase